MKRNQLVAVLALLVGAIVLVLLVARAPQRSDSPGVPATSVSGSQTLVDAALTRGTTAREAVRSAADSPAAAPSLPVAVLPTGLRVRSAEGLALAFVEIENAPGSWQRCDLFDGACTLDTASLPCGVRAPGHLARTAERIDDELVLEADALLVLEAPDLQSCVKSIEPLGGYTGKSSYATGGAEEIWAEWRKKVALMMTYGFTGKDRWAVAVGGGGLGEPFGYRRDLDIDLEDRTHRLTRIEFEATPGARAHWSVPCNPALSAAPLGVEIVRPVGSERGELLCALSIHREAGVAATRIDQAWGHVVVGSDLSYRVEARLAPEESTWRVPDVPVGEQTALIVRDKTSGAYGRVFFQHDGTSRRVVLQAGFGLHGRIVVPTGSATPQRARVHFGRPSTDPARRIAIDALQTELHGVEIAPDGSFAVRGPKNVHAAASLSADRPSELALQIEANGFDLHHSIWHLGEAADLDCGTILLVPSRAPILLAPGHDLGERIEWSTMRSGAERNQVWTVRNGRLEPDGALSLVFDDDWLARNDPDNGTAEEIQEEIRLVQSALPVAAATPAFLIDMFSDWARAFVRGADGRYERVDERDYEVEVVASAVVADDSKVTIEWQWRGIPQWLATLGPDRAGVRRTLRFRAPREGVSVSWSTDDEPGGDARAGAGSVSLDSPSVAVKVP